MLIHDKLQVLQNLVFNQKLLLFRNICASIHQPNTTCTKCVYIYVHYILVSKAPIENLAYNRFILGGVFHTFTNEWNATNYLGKCALNLDTANQIT